MMPLEDRFPRPDLTAPVDGIIVLGGSVDTLVSKGRGVSALNEAGERLTKGAALAKRFPDARLVFSCEILYDGMTEAAGAKQFFARFGLAPERLILQDRSRNTVENAAFTRKLVDPQPGERWLLVTSAFHMPRAVGFEVIPWPVDYRTSGGDEIWRFFPRASEGLRRVDLAAKEWAGLLAYYIT
jgi:uncharacterized SAM-binding protein YcdF (DUF218 family)